MGNEFSGQPGHSAEYFGDSRDFWWNLDFLELVARRFRLDVVRDVLDVGCGVGHWSATLAQVLPASARITGVDREPAWVEHAARGAPERGLAGRAFYRVAEAERLPFADDSFDLTTCQTLLIHLRDPAAGLAEMRRVTRPGGLLMVAEPNNLAQSLVLDSVSSRASVDDVMALVRLQMTCERGKVALGEGDNSLGSRVPSLFVEQGLADVEVFVNDKAAAVHAPYATPEQRAFCEDVRDRVARGFWTWSEADTRRFFLAGGGSEPEFAALFARGLALLDETLRALADGRYHALLGGAFYLVTGRKDAARA